jgi:hypothetical protein
MGTGKGNNLMNILTIENITMNMLDLPTEVDDLRFAILDNSDPNDPDYFFVPLIFLESFTAPAAVLNIGGKMVKMPLDWQVMVGDPEIGDLEVVPLTSISERGFETLTVNPLTSFRPIFEKIDIVDVYPEVKWYFPKLRAGHLLAVPLTEGDNPNCVFFAREISRTQQIVKIDELW